MDMKTLRSKTTQGLERELEEAQQHLKELRFKLSSHQLKNVREVRKVRQTIAQLKTILKEQAAKTE